MVRFTSIYMASEMQLMLRLGYHTPIDASLSTYPFRAMAETLSNVPSSYELPAYFK